MCTVVFTLFRLLCIMHIYVNVSNNVIILFSWFSHQMSGSLKKQKNKKHYFDLMKMFLVFCNKICHPKRIRTGDPSPCFYFSTLFCMQSITMPIINTFSGENCDGKVPTHHQFSQAWWMSGWLSVIEVFLYTSTLILIFLSKGYLLANIYNATLKTSLGNAY